MRKSALLLSALAVLTACKSSQEPMQNTASSNSEKVVTAVEAVAKTESERLNEWFAVKYEENLQRNPIMLTFIGRKDKYDEIGDFSEEEEQRQLLIAKADVAELKAKFDYDKLDDEAKVSYDIWMYQHQQRLAGQKFRYNGYIFTQMNGIQAFAAQFLINFHKVDQESDMTAYITRIGGISKGIATLLERAKKHADYGVRAPRFAYDGVIEQAKALIDGAPFKEGKDVALWADAKRKIAELVKAEKIDQARADELTAEAEKALKEHFLPSYQALVTWFEQDLKNTEKIATGVANQPNGKAYYNYQLKGSTTTDLTADEIHEIGLSEVARITKEMEEIKERVGFKGTLQEFFKFIKTDEQFFYPNTDEGRQGYITDTEVFLAGINKKLPEFFGILPKADLVVKRVEPFREQDGAAQHYFPGTPDGSRPGVYYAHLSDMSSMPKNEMEGIAYHEGNPGHHMQISIAQELTSVPQFRTQAGFTAYSEGWGLYAELLAKEMGGYQDDYSDFGRLVNEIWRAVRLVVDTGIHSKGWTEAQAVEYFKNSAPVAEEAIKSEVRRYIVWPGQATAYKIGMLKIIELRKQAEKTLGDKFDIRGFHDTILGGGAMPLALLERRVNLWVEANK